MDSAPWAHRQAVGSRREADSEAAAAWARWQVELVVACRQVAVACRQVARSAQAAQGGLVVLLALGGPADRVAMAATWELLAPAAGAQAAEVLYRSVVVADLALLSPGSAADPLQEPPSGTSPVLGGRVECQALPLPSPGPTSDRRAVR